MRAPVISALIGGLALLFACGGGGDSRDPACDEAATVAATDYDWIQDNVWSQSCSSSDCHGGTMPEEGLDMRAGTSHAEIVNISSIQVPSLNIVSPGDATNSYLMIKLGRDPQGRRMESRMPKSSRALCEEKIDLIEDWIAAGAPQ